MELLAATAVLACGIWFMMRPEVIIRTAQHAHPSLREDDPAVRSIAKVIGVGWAFTALVWLIAAIADGRWR